MSTSGSEKKLHCEIYRTRPKVNAVSSMTDAIAARAGVEDSDGLIGGLMLIGGMLPAMAGMSMQDNQHLRSFMVLFTILSLIAVLATFFLKESPMIRFKKD